MRYAKSIPRQHASYCCALLQDCGIYRRRSLQQVNRRPPPHPRSRPPPVLQQPRPPRPTRPPPPRPRSPPTTAVPTALDWRARGAVSPVLSQGYCASCYAFAAAAAIEGAVAIAKKKTVSAISPQPWVDCFRDFYGCGERMRILRTNCGCTCQNPAFSREKSCSSCAKGTTDYSCAAMHMSPRRWRRPASARNGVGRKAGCGSSDGIPHHSPHG